MLNERPIYPVNFDDFNFRISYNIEEAINRNGSKFGIEIINSWDKSKKIFRYINRVTFIHTDYPIQIDLSIVRSSNKLDKYNLKPEYTAEQSGVFTNPESYEIEIEVVNSKLQDFYVVDPVLQGIRKAIKFVLSGLQGTNYPVSYLEQSQVANEYMQLMFGKEYTMPWYGLKPGSFIGPSSYTLQTENIAPVNENTNIPNIRKGYTVTDKADGERRLMIISSVGKIYLISTNMSVIFTGAVTTEKTIFNSLLDGEIIYHNKMGEFINLFAAFDIYYINGIDVRALEFIPNGVENAKEKKKFRYPLLKSLIKLLTGEALAKPPASVLQAP